MSYSGSSSNSNSNSNSNSLSRRRRKAYDLSTYKLITATYPHEYEYEDEGEEVQCRCRCKAVRKIAWTSLNPGRRFYGCRNYGIDELFCKFIVWIDAEFSERCKELILELIDREKWLFEECKFWRQQALQLRDHAKDIVEAELIEENLALKSEVAALEDQLKHAHSKQEIVEAEKKALKSENAALRKQLKEAEKNFGKGKCNGLLLVLFVVMVLGYFFVLM